MILFGVDVVELDRVASAVDRNGAAYVGHVLTPAEALAVDAGGGDHAVAAAIAVKECLIKAVGGRPEGFRWHDFSRSGAEPDWAGPEFDRLPMDSELTESAGYAVIGASRRAALAVLGGDSTTVRACARWGISGGLVVAVGMMRGDQP